MITTQFVDFRPAQVMGIREVYVCYYVLDPTTGRLKRMRVRCNRLKNRRDKVRQAQMLSDGSFFLRRVGRGYENIRTFVPSKEAPPYTFTMRYRYDSFNRMQNIFYPDGEDLTCHSNLHEGCHRKYCWDEDNRLQGFVDCVAVGLYQYDANGERTYKLTGENLQQGVNRNEHSYASFNEATLYASPYVVCTPQGYTKHYYADNERVASRIGNGCLSDIDRCINPTSNVDKTDDYNKLYFPESENNELVIDKMRRSNFYLTNVLECLSAEDNNEEANLLRKLYDFKDCPNTCEKDCYWYHPDHLGSSSWITYYDGKAVQHLHYLPWGEDFVDQRTTNWHARFTFSAKEKDAESGLSYFGARYYNSDLSMWLSVDPMCDKYPSPSPYVYCADNPVKLVDPNGEEWEVNESGYIRQVGDKNNNTLYAVKGATEMSFGERKTKEDGTFISMEADEKIMNTMTSQGIEKTSYIAMNNRDKMIETFNFMADNTDVEWAMIGEHIDVGSTTEQMDILFTSHQNVQCDARFDQVVRSGKEFRLDYHRHSHPNRYTGNNPLYSIMYPTTSHYTSRNDRDLRDSASPANYVNVRPDFILRNRGYDFHY